MLCAIQLENFVPRLFQACDYKKDDWVRPSSSPTSLHQPTSLWSSFFYANRSSLAHPSSFHIAMRSYFLLALASAIALVQALPVTIPRDLVGESDVGGDLDSFSWT
jgi:hypothetical protein